MKNYKISAKTMVERYYQDYICNLFSSDEIAVVTVKLTDIYLAVDDGIYSRSEGVKKQKELLDNYEIKKDYRMC